MNSNHSSQGISLTLMKKYFAIVAAFLAATSCLLFFTEKAKIAESKSQTLTLSLRDYLLRSFLAELPDINKKLPYAIDDNTVLLRIEYKDEKIIHLYELPKFRKNKDSESKLPTTLGSALKRQACADPIRQNMLKAGIDFLSIYQDSAGQQIFEIPIDQSSCSDTTPTSQKSS
jgi:hypothetical protein